MRGVLVTTLVAVLAAACGDDDDDGTPFEPSQTADGNEVGTMCEEDLECGDPEAGAECCTGGKCGPDGWCSPRCESDRDCPLGYVCVDHDGTRCFWECETDRDCPADFLCEEKNDRMSCRYKEDTP